MDADRLSVSADIPLTPQQAVCNAAFAILRPQGTYDPQADTYWPAQFAPDLSNMDVVVAAILGSAEAQYVFATLYRRKIALSSTPLNVGIPTPVPSGRIYDVVREFSATAAGVQQALDAASNGPAGQVGGVFISQAITDVQQRLSPSGPQPIIVYGPSRQVAGLQAAIPGINLLSLPVSGSCIHDLYLDQTVNTTVWSPSATQPNPGAGHCLGSGADRILVQRLAVRGGASSFAIYWSGDGGQRTVVPGDPSTYAQGSIIDDLILSDGVCGDSLSWSFQSNWLIQNVRHTGSRLALFRVGTGRVNGYEYTPGPCVVADRGWWMTSPCSDVTIHGFHSAGKGGRLGTAPDQAHMNARVTLDDLQMLPTETIGLGDCQNLTLSNSRLGVVNADPNLQLTGTVQNTTHGAIHANNKVTLTGW